VTTITRPETGFDGASHTYSMKKWEEVLGVSTVAKVGEDEAFGIASAWGFRVGYEGVHDLLKPGMTKDELRDRLKKRGLTPWSSKKKAADRGTWVHDVLEALATDGTLPDLSKAPEERKGHAQGVLKWFVDYRPEFVATEVQVSSEQHGFAGRYDIRCLIEGTRIGTKQPDNPKWCVGCSADPDNMVDQPCCGCNETQSLCLIDLKTSKGVYPTSHFPQLAGYELASVEMGFPQTAAQFVLNTHPDGTYDFVRSLATGEDFLAYLAAARAIRGIKTRVKESK
jgi:hypothetical protein